MNNEPYNLTDEDIKQMTLPTDVMGGYTQAQLEAMRRSGIKNIERTQRRADQEPVNIGTAANVYTMSKVKKPGKGRGHKLPPNLINEVRIDSGATKSSQVQTDILPPSKNETSNYRSNVNQSEILLNPRQKQVKTSMDASMLIDESNENQKSRVTDYTIKGLSEANEAYLRAREAEANRTLASRGYSNNKLRRQVLEGKQGDVLAKLGFKFKSEKEFNKEFEASQAQAKVNAQEYYGPSIEGKQVQVSNNLNDEVQLRDQNVNLTGANSPDTNNKNYNIMSSASNYNPAEPKASIVIQENPQQNRIQKRNVMEDVEMQESTKPVSIPIRESIQTEQNISNIGKKRLLGQDDEEQGDEQKIEYEPPSKILKSSEQQDVSQNQKAKQDAAKQIELALSAGKMFTKMKNDGFEVDKLTEALTKKPVEKMHQAITSLYMKYNTQKQQEEVKQQEEKTKPDFNLNVEDISSNHNKKMEDDIKLWADSVTRVPTVDVREIQEATKEGISLEERHKLWNAINKKSTKYFLERNQATERERIRNMTSKEIDEERKREVQKNELITMMNVQKKLMAVGETARANMAQDPLLERMQEQNLERGQRTVNAFHSQNAEFAKIQAKIDANKQLQQQQENKEKEEDELNPNVNIVANNAPIISSAETINPIQQVAEQKEEVKNATIEEKIDYVVRFENNYKKYVDQRNLDRADTTSHLNYIKNIIKETAKEKQSEKAEDLKKTGIEQVQRLIESSKQTEELMINNLENIRKQNIDSTLNSQLVLYNRPNQPIIPIQELIKSLQDQITEEKKLQDEMKKEILEIGGINTAQPLGKRKFSSFEQGADTDTIMRLHNRKKQKIKQLSFEESDKNKINIEMLQLANMNKPPDFNINNASVTSIEELNTEINRPIITEPDENNETVEQMEEKIDNNVPITTVEKEISKSELKARNKIVNTSKAYKNDFEEFIQLEKTKPNIAELVKQYWKEEEPETFNGYQDWLKNKDKSTYGFNKLEMKMARQSLKIYKDHPDQLYALSQEKPEKAKWIFKLMQDEDKKALAKFEDWQEDNVTISGQVKVPDYSNLPLFAKIPEASKETKPAPVVLKSATLEPVKETVISDSSNTAASPTSATGQSINVNDTSIIQSITTKYDLLDQAHSSGVDSKSKLKAKYTLRKELRDKEKKYISKSHLENLGTYAEADREKLQQLQKKALGDNIISSPSNSNNNFNVANPNTQKDIAMQDNTNIRTIANTTLSKREYGEKYFPQINPRNQDEQIVFKRPQFSKLQQQDQFETTIDRTVYANPPQEFIDKYFGTAQTNINTSSMNQATTNTNINGNMPSFNQMQNQINTTVVSDDLDQIIQDYDIAMDMDEEMAQYMKMNNIGHQNNNNTIQMNDDHSNNVLLEEPNFNLQDIDMFDPSGLQNTVLINEQNTDNTQDTSNIQQETDFKVIDEGIPQTNKTIKTNQINKRRNKIKSKFIQENVLTSILKPNENENETKINESFGNNEEQITQQIIKDLETGTFELPKTTENEFGIDEKDDDDVFTLEQIEKNIQEYTDADLIQSNIESSTFDAFDLKEAQEQRVILKKMIDYWKKERAKLKPKYQQEMPSSKLLNETIIMPKFINEETAIKTKSKTKTQNQEEILQSPSTETVLMPPSLNTEIQNQNKPLNEFAIEEKQQELKDKIDMIKNEIAGQKLKKSNAGKDALIKQAANDMIEFYRKQLTLTHKELAVLTKQKGKTLSTQMQQEFQPQSGTQVINESPQNEYKFAEENIKSLTSAIPEDYTTQNKFLEETLNLNHLLNQQEFQPQFKDETILTIPNYDFNLQNENEVNVFSSVQEDLLNEQDQGQAQINNFQQVLQQEPNEQTILDQTLPQLVQQDVQGNNENILMNENIVLPMQQNQGNAPILKGRNKVLHGQGSSPALIKETILSHSSAVPISQPKPSTVNQGSGRSALLQAIQQRGQIGQIGPIGKVGPKLINEQAQLKNLQMNQGSIPQQTNITQPIANQAISSPIAVPTLVNTNLAPPISLNQNLIQSVPYTQINQNAKNQSLIRNLPNDYQLNEDFGFRASEYNTAVEKQLQHNIKSNNQDYENVISKLANDMSQDSYPISEGTVREIMPVGEYLKLMNDQGYYNEWEQRMFNVLEDRFKASNPKFIEDLKSPSQTRLNKEMQMGAIIYHLHKGDLIENNWKDFQTERFIKENMDPITFNKLVFQQYYHEMQPEKMYNTMVDKMNKKGITNRSIIDELQRSGINYQDASLKLEEKINSGEINMDQAINSLNQLEAEGWKDLFTVMNNQRLSNDDSLELFNILKEEKDYAKIKASKEIGHIGRILDHIKQMNTRENGTMINSALETRLQQTISAFKHNQIGSKQVYNELSSMMTHPHPFITKKVRSISREIEDKDQNVVEEHMKEPDEIYFNRMRTSGYIAVPGLIINDNKFDAIPQIGDKVYEIQERDATEIFHQMNRDQVLQSFLKIKPTARGNTVVKLREELKKINEQMHYTYNIQIDPSQFAVKNKAQVVASVYKIQSQVAELERNLAYRMDHPPSENDLEFFKRTQEKRGRISELVSGPIELRPHEEMLENLEENVRQNIQKALYDNEISSHENQGKILNFGPHVKEFLIETEEDLEKLKQQVEISKGTLYTINLQSGKMFPVSIHQVEIGKRYILVSNEHPNKKSVHVAKNAVRGGILLDNKKLLPFMNIQGANDKIINRIHQIHHFLPRKISPHEELKHQAGGSFLKGIVKKVSNGIQAMKSAAPKKLFSTITNELKPVSDLVTKYKPIVNATKDFVKSTKNEFQTIKSIPKSYNNTKKSFNSFVKNPSLKKGVQVLRRGSNLISKPVFAAGREITHVSDFANKIPGIREGKMALELALPPLGLIDQGARAVKDLSEGKYLKVMTDGISAAAGNASPFVNAAQNVATEAKAITAK